MKKYLLIEQFLNTTTITKCPSIKVVEDKLEKNKDQEFELYEYKGVAKWKGV